MDMKRLIKRLCCFYSTPRRAWPYDEFIRWFMPPSKPPEMTEDEKLDASSNRLAKPPMCHRGTEAILINLMLA